MFVHVCVCARSIPLEMDGERSSGASEYMANRGVCGRLQTLEDNAVSVPAGCSQAINSQPQRITDGKPNHNAQQRKEYGRGG